jgi:hypothetical protein
MTDLHDPMPRRRSRKDSREATRQVARPSSSHSTRNFGAPPNPRRRRGYLLKDSLPAELARESPQSSAANT